MAKPRPVLLFAWGYALLLIIAACAVGLFAYQHSRRNLESMMEERLKGYGNLLAQRLERATLIGILDRDKPDGDPQVQYAWDAAQLAQRSIGVRRIVFFEYRGPDLPPVVALDTLDKSARGREDFVLRVDAEEIARTAETGKPAATILYELEDSPGEGARPAKSAYSLVPALEGDVRPEDFNRQFMVAVELPAEYGSKLEKLRNIVLGVVAGFSLFVLATTALTVARYARMQRRLQQQQRLAELAALSAGIAHEIKNPLAAMLTGIQLLTRDLNPRQARLAAHLEREVRLLDRIVKDFLAFARGAQRKPEHATTGTIVAQVREQLTPAQRACLEVRGDMNEGMTVDLAALVQALGNLVKNACQAACSAHPESAGSDEKAASEAEIAKIQATPAHGLSTAGVDTAVLNSAQIAPALLPGAQPRVVLTVSARGKNIAFTVEDNGAGVPEAVVARLFQPFVSGKEGGTGLGLAITRRLFEDAGGNVKLARTGASGTLFEAVVPRGE